MKSADNLFDKYRGRRRFCRITRRRGTLDTCMKSFASWYNGEHLHSAIRFVTPDARHDGRDHATLASRAILYAKTRAQNPKRWSGKTRNWQPARPVWLNPENEISAPEIRDAA